MSLIQHCPEALGDDCVPGHDPGALALLSLKLAKFYSEPENKRFQGEQFITLTLRLRTYMIVLKSLITIVLTILYSNC